MKKTLSLAQTRSVAGGVAIAFDAGGDIYDAPSSSGGSGASAGGGLTAIDVGMAALFDGVGDGPIDSALRSIGQTIQDAQYYMSPRAQWDRSLERYRERMGGNVVCGPRG